MIGMTGLAYCSVMIMVMPFASRISFAAVDDDFLVCRAEAEQRLVKKEDPGLGHQRPADGQHLLLAAA